MFLLQEKDGIWLYIKLTFSVWFDIRSNFDQHLPTNPPVLGLVPILTYVALTVALCTREIMIKIIILKDVFRLDCRFWSICVIFHKICRLTEFQLRNYAFFNSSIQIRTLSLIYLTSYLNLRRFELIGDSIWFVSQVLLQEYLNQACKIFSGKLNFTYTWVVRATAHWGGGHQWVIPF